MKALILCAGRGKRLRPLTDKIPKPLVEINNKSLLERILEQLEYFNINDIYLLVGYKKELIKERLKGKFERLNITYIHNPFHSKLNNLFSVWLSKPYLRGQDFLLINADIVFDDIILKKAIDSKLGNFCVIDVTKPLPEDSMKVKIKGNSIVDFGKELKGGDGYTVGIHRFSKEGSKIFLDEIEDMLEKEKDDYHHGAMLNIVDKYGFDQKALTIKDLLWCEIDEFVDIKKAEKVFSAEN